MLDHSVFVTETPC